MVTKYFGEGKDFYSEGGALTLPFYDVRSGEALFEAEWHEETFPSGWTIKGTVSGDYYEYMNGFSASHPQHGKVWGDFEDMVYADTEEGFQHFYSNHTPDAWCYDFV